MIPATFSPFLNDVLNHLWQSTLFAVAAWALCRTVLRENSPRVRYGVWLAASLKFLVPFAALVGLGRKLGWPSKTPVVSTSLWIETVDRATRGAATTPFVPAGPIVPGREESPVFLYLLFGAWACGVLIVAVNWWRCWMQVRQAARTASPIKTVDGIPVLSSPLLKSLNLEPGVFGLRRQVVLVPDGIESHLTPAQFEAVLAHECTHARRRDNLAATAHMAVEAIFWFHPLVWWMGRQLMEEREGACDEEVLRRADPEVYAESILNVCKFYREVPLRCVAGITGSDLKQRIEAVMTRRMGTELSAIKRRLLIAAVAVAIAGPIAIGLVTAPAARAQSANSFSGLQTSAEKKFEVATVKLNPSGGARWRLGPPERGSVSIDNLELKKIIASSFRIQDSLVEGPGWLTEKRYNIVGKGPDSTVANPVVWEMMRALLAERFHLKYHLETRERPIFAMTVAKGGHKLTKGENGRCAQEIREGKTCGDLSPAPGNTGIWNMPVAALIGGLARAIQDRPIVDRTGLTGNWDGFVRWIPDNNPEFAQRLTELPPETRALWGEETSVFTAIEHQLGLKLESQRGPVQVVVIDSIDEPTEN